MTAFAHGQALDVGQVRPVNQDHVHADDGLFIVADGMGGHRGGEVASRLAIDTVLEHFTERTTDALVRAVQEANAAVVAEADGNPDLKGMGTTIAALARVSADDRDLLAVVNVGDSRIYLLRSESGDLEQITEDHSLVATLERQGKLTADEAAVHPQRNILTRALGSDRTVLVDSWETLPVVGDRYLLCSDGLFNEVSAAKIGSVLRRLDSADEAAAELVRVANEAGGHDNISVVVVDVIEADTTVEGPGTERVVAITHGERRDGHGRVEEAIPARPDSSGADAGGDGREVAPAGAAGDPAPHGTGGDDGDATASGDDGAADEPETRGPRSRFTWRVALFLAVLLALVGGTFGILAWIAQNTYYVGAGEDEVTIYQGRPGGLLWFDPVAVEGTGLTLDELPEPARRDVRDGHQESSLEEAQRYVENLREQIDDTASTRDGDRPDGRDDEDADGDATDRDGEEDPPPGAAVGGDLRPPAPAPSLP